MNSTQKFKWYKGKHLLIVILSFVMFFLQAILTSGCMNTVWPVLAEMRGWDINAIYASQTPFTIIYALLTIPIGGLVAKYGARNVTSIGFVLLGIATIVWGLVTSQAAFIAILLVVDILIVFNNQSNPTIISAWFPRTKGIVLGWATMGIIFSDIVFSPYVPNMLGNIGIEKTYGIIGALIIAFGVVTYLLVRNTPEECGCMPDNAPLEDGVDPREEAKKMAEYKSDWTLGKVLKTKEAWFIMVAFGLLWLASGTFLGQIVPRIVDIGYDFSVGVRVMQYSAVAALIGSWALGEIDQKLGTKRACVIFAVWEIIMFSCALLMRKSMAFVWIAPMGIMFGVGAIANLQPSLIISVWGRKDFIAVQRVVQTGVSLILALSYLLTAIRPQLPGGFDTLYIGFIVGAFVAIFLIMKVEQGKYMKEEI